MFLPSLQGGRRQGAGGFKRTECFVIISILCHLTLITGACTHLLSLFRMRLCGNNLLPKFNGHGQIRLQFNRLSEVVDREVVLVFEEVSRAAPEISLGGDPVAVQSP